ncbi:hypothetical protein BH23CYA1_BH23CYA1_13670 [soil metagenome]
MTLNATQLELPYFIPTAENVQQSLSALGTAKATPTAVQDEDFHLFRQRQRRQPWRWEGAGRYVGTYSERNFATEAAAVADAQAKLT